MKIKRLHIIDTLPDGKYRLQDRPDLVLTKEELEKLKRLIQQETGGNHLYII